MAVHVHVHSYGFSYGLQIMEHFNYENLNPAALKEGRKKLHHSSRLGLIG